MKSYFFWINNALKAQGSPNYSPPICCYIRDRTTCLRGQHCECKPTVKEQHHGHAKIL